MDTKILITESSYKNEILKSTKSLINIKFMTLQEFINSYYFTYDEKTILYLINKYDIKYEIALEYLKNLIYVEDKKYNIEKLDFLVDLKKELISNNLLIFDSSFKDYIKDKEIIVYKYSLNKFEKYLLKGINYKIVEKENNNYLPKIYEFETIEAEVEYVARSISKLISDGVNINNIKLANIGEDYINIIDKIFKFYNLKIGEHNNIPIISNIVGKTFYDNLTDINSGLNSISEYSNTETYKTILDICNKYAWCDNVKDLNKLIEYDLKNTYIKYTKYNYEIEVIDYKSYEGNDYVFLMSLNQGIIPTIYKDEDYITDSIKPSYMDSVVEKNKFEKLEVIKSIKNIKNLTITYKLRSDLDNFYPSSIISELCVNVERVKLDLKNSYSELSDKLLLTHLIDNYIKYGEEDENLYLLNSNYDIPYNTYSHEFTGLSKSKLKEYIDNQKTFNLSYTHMDNYNRCNFRFFIDKILCLNLPNDDMGIIIGNICHYVLEKAVKTDIDVKNEVENYIKDNNIELTNSNKFFVNRTITNLEFVIEVLKKQQKFCSLKRIETEKFIKIPLINNINFIGFIDKIIYDIIDNTYYATIIDYKTYAKKPSLKYLDYGIGLQLPVYMYLTKYSFKNVKFAGFYLQNISLNNKSDEEKEKNLKLIGFTNKDKDILEKFDSNYMNSSVIDGIKVNNDGSFSQNSLKTMLSKEEIDSIIEITKNKIDETLKNIMNAKFDINPKYDEESIGCEFCKYRDLCFRKDYDYVKIKAKEGDYFEQVD